tara:strand:+ start:4527 stop:5801 length:1275 start_codon:yes stop_codon:yes gene_type:complete
LRNNFKLKLADVIEEIYRYPTFYGIEYKTEGIPVIKGENISKDGLIDEVQDFDYIDEETNSKFHKTQLLKGDLIFTVRGLIGKVGYFTKERGNINANVIKIRIKEDYNSYFYWLYLNSSIGQKLIQNVTSGQVQATITVDDILNIPIPNFDDDKEDEIIKLLESTYQSKVLKLQQAQKLVNGIDIIVKDELDLNYDVNQTPKSVFKITSKQLEERIDPYYYRSDFVNIIEELKSSDLKIIPFSNLIDKLTNGHDSRAYKDSGTPYLKVANIRPFKYRLKDVKYVEITNDDFSKDIDLKEDDLLITRKGTFGLVKRVDEDSDAIISSEIFRVRLKDKSLSKYLEVVLNSSIVQKQFDRVKIGAIMGSLSQSALSSVFIPLPDEDTKNRIVDKVYKNISQADKLELEAETEFQQAKQKVEQIILGK